MMIDHGIDDSSTITNNVVLPGYQAQPSDNGVAHSRNKLEEAAHDLKLWVDDCSMLPCQVEDDTYAYRCICTFQLIQNDNSDFQYAMRHQKAPVVLNGFPIATHRIQQVMKGLLPFLSQHYILGTHLTSASFASSWSDGKDCFVTLLYGQPVNQEEWDVTAQQVCRELQLTRLIGRSKGRVFFVHGGTSSRDYLEDSIYIYRSGDGSNQVTLSKHSNVDTIEVQYRKPETAFFHPNSNAMIQALTWMMGRLQAAAVSKPCHLLEMYCGCGAHTVALAKMGFCDSIVAVELDKRLVEACITNCQLNGCHGDNEGNGDDTETTTLATPVHAFQGDASEWAKKSLKSKKSGGWYDKDYSILLVDPPRSGLDATVCDMAMQGTSFQHLIYISCGRHALKRDLERLKDCFEVVDCQLLDLFPRTDAVESLVHLKRRAV
jgi:tRNA (uracil-5-)-methyltransferase